MDYKISEGTMQKLASFIRKFDEVGVLDKDTMVRTHGTSDLYLTINEAGDKQELIGIEFNYANTLFFVNNDRTLGIHIVEDGEIYVVEDADVVRVIEKALIVRLKFLRLQKKLGFEPLSQELYDQVKDTIDDFEDEE